MRRYMILALLAVTAQSHGDAFRVGVGIGSGDVSLSSNYKAEADLAGDSPIAMGLSLGYVMPNNLLIDFGISSVSDAFLGSVTDNVRLSSYELQVGYLYKYGSFYIEPTLGVANWDFDLEEGELFNSGPEYHFDDNGVDPFLLMKLGHRFGDLFGLSFAYKYLDFDYGKAQTYLIGFDFAF